MGLAKQFHSYSIWKDAPFNDEAVFDTIFACLTEGGVFTNETGFIGGIVVPLHFNPMIKIATELAWFAPQGGGRELRESFEDWARESGAHIVQFSALGDGKIDKVHENFVQNGFVLAELQYLKRL